jgi:hypothetical protein
MSDWATCTAWCSATRSGEACDTDTLVRLRTDTVWLRNWPSLSHGGALPIPPASIARPSFRRNSILLDHFFICSREVSWACFYEAPLLIHRSWDRGQLHVATGCPRVSVREHASIDCHRSIFGINCTWPEAILTGLFRRLEGDRPHSLVDSCSFTAEFMVRSCVWEGECV